MLKGIVLALVIVGMGAVLPGVEVSSFWSAILVVVVLWILNQTIAPLVHVIALPVTVLTLGLFALVINGLFVLLADAVVSGFSVASLGTAILFSIVITVVNMLLERA